MKLKKVKGESRLLKIISKGENLRKLIHLSGVFLIPASVYLSQEFVVLAGFIMTIAYVVADYFRFRGERIAFITDLIKKCARKSELKSWLLTPVYLMLSVTLLLAFFDRRAAYIGIIAATLGDGMAALYGANYGKHRIVRGKSLEGCFAFFAFTFFASLFFVDFFTAFVVGFIATFVELFSGKIDNITVPFSAAFATLMLRSLA